MSEPTYGQSPMLAWYKAWQLNNLLLDMTMSYFERSFDPTPFDREYVWSETLQEWVYVGSRGD